MAGIAGRAIPPGECIRGRKACGYGDSARRSNGEKSRAFNSTIGHVRGKGIDRYLFGPSDFEGNAGDCPQANKGVAKHDLRWTPVVRQPEP